MDGNRSSVAEQYDQRSDLLMDCVERKKYRRGMFSLVFKILLVFAFALVVLFRFASITEIGHKINKAQKQYEALEEENRQLNKELAAMTNIETLKEMAEERFEMNVPKENQKVYIESATCDRTELYNIELTEDKEETDTKTTLIEKLKRFVGIV